MSLSSAPSRQQGHLEGLESDQLFSEDNRDIAALPASSQDHSGDMPNNHSVNQATCNPAAANPAMNSAQAQPAPARHTVPLQPATAATITQLKPAAASIATRAAQLSEAREIGEVLLAINRIRITAAEAHQLPTNQYLPTFHRLPDLYEQRRHLLQMQAMIPDTADR